MPNPKNRSVVALVYDGLCTFEFGIVAEVFGLPRPEMGNDWYNFNSVGLETGALYAAGGLKFTPTASRDDLDAMETLIIPGWRGKDAVVPDTIIDAVRTAAGRGVRLVTICSGVYVLAHAGLLSGRRVTTHWRYAEDFQAKFPEVHLEPDNLFIEDGNILTSAGSSAGIDLCLHIVRQDFGAKIANAVARRLVMHAHRQGGQTQYIDHPLPQHHDADRLSSTVEYIQTHLADAHSVRSLAQKAGMSERTFQRRFSALTGQPIAKWITQERLTQACAMLEVSQANLDTIALSTGFGTTENLRYHFRNRFEITPTQYRHRFYAGTNM